MVNDDVAVIALLRRLDDADHPTGPREYDEGKISAVLDRLVSRLEADFATPCPAQRYHRNTVEYARVVVPGEATVCGERIVVSVSNFGSLAMVAAENPGAYLGTDDAREEGALDPGDLATVERALVDIGYVVVSEELLHTRYDGPAPLRKDERWPPTWWNRYFGHP
ncbi:hypothetical protein ACFZBU_45775 [Embleya sp. NPDC008237]|uniref:hypothetical protein n=1 Tax=Embleya sp. NPDC008237 TaxID=3363978 RepID=UPI0036E7EE8E